MANDRDQALLRSAVSDAAANLLAFVPSLGTREVLAFGEGVALPTRLKFMQLPDDLLPKSEAVINARMDVVQGADADMLNSVIERWRGATMSHGRKGDADGAQDLDAIAQSEFAPLAPSAVGAASAGLDPERFRLLKRPGEGDAAVAAAGPSLRKPTAWPPK
jgi:hypothetical protein